MYFNFFILLDSIKAKGLVLYIFNCVVCLFLLTLGVKLT